MQVPAVWAVVGLDHSFYVVIVAGVDCGVAKDEQCFVVLGESEAWRWDQEEDEEEEKIGHGDVGRLYNR